MSESPVQWAGIILAAGESRRMGRLKQLLPFGPHTVLEQVVEVARESRLSPIVVVLGHEAERLAARLPAYAQAVQNPDYRSGGMLSSVRRGIRELPDAIAAAVVFLGDNVTVTVEVVSELRSTWEADGRPADRFYVPTYEGARGHPLCVTAGLLQTVLEWRGEHGLRGMLQRHAHQVCEVPVAERGILLDVDTPEDYRRAMTWYQRRLG